MVENKKRIKRINIEMTDEEIALLKGLQSRLGSTATSTIKRALKMLLFVLEEQDSGSSLIIEKQDKKQEKVLIMF